MSSLDEIYRAIGHLQGGQESTQRQMEDLIAEVRSMRDSLHSLPPSPAYLEKHDQLKEEISKLKVTNAKHASMLGAITGSAVIFIKWFADIMGIVPLTGPHN